MQLRDIIDTKRVPIFACIGTTKSYYDSTSNRIGKMLENEGFCVIYNMNNVNMDEKSKELDKKIKRIEDSGKKTQVIGLDLCISKHKDKPFKYKLDGIKPGAALGRKHDVVGEVGIHIILNYFLEEDILDGDKWIYIVCKKVGYNDKLEKAEKELANNISDLYKNFIEIENE